MLFYDAKNKTDFKNKNLLSEWFNDALAEH